ncbi:MAG: aldo/keto reductase [Acidimicrobiaceae bacterium]|nr:aldo/keto reductase [Acidimicrobiaceae bacterium]
MRTSRIGSLEVSVIGLGGNDYNSGFERVTDVVSAALDAGITFFDSAEDYGAGRSEETLGRALGRRRDEIVLSSKYHGQPAEVHAKAEASLRRLGTDHLDLYLLHRPVAGVPLAETLGALSELVEEGKVREIGFSNVDVAQMREAASAATEHHFVNVQGEYNLLSRRAEVEIIPECAATGLAFTAYFPIYHGFLTGSFSRGGPLAPGSRLAVASEARKAAVFTDEHFDILEALTAFAKDRGHSVLDLALARLLAEPGVAAVIPGASLPEHATASAAAGDWVLTPEEIAEVDRIVPYDPASPGTPSTMNGFPV